MLGKIFQRVSTIFIALVTKKAELLKICGINT